MAVSADGTTVAATSGEGRVLILRHGQADPTLLDGLRPAGPLALSGDGLTLAFADSDRQVQIWRIEKPGRKVLLTIAVDAIDPGTRLKTPMPDVGRVADVLERRYGFELNRLDNPSRAELLKALDELSARLVPQDHLLIYFSGFASYADTGKSRKGERRFNFYLPPGSRGASIEFSAGELAARVAAIPVRQLLTIVDTSGAGALATLPKSATASGGARGLLYSAEADQFSNDTADFSTALANALAIAPGPLTGRALATEVARRLPADVRKVQTPGYADWLAAGHGGGEVLLVPSGPTLPEIATKRREAVSARQPTAASSAAPDPSALQQQQTQVPPTVTLQPGAVFRECPDCPEMVVIPAGECLMGSPEVEVGREEDEGPQHLVTIGRPFAVGKYEVTFDEWDACVAAGGCRYKGDDSGWGRGRRPVIKVTPTDARNYVVWLSKLKFRHSRSPADAEDIPAPQKCFEKMQKKT